MPYLSDFDQVVFKQPRYKFAIMIVLVQSQSVIQLNNVTVIIIYVQLMQSQWAYGFVRIVCMVIVSVDCI